jgi:hypothetical protein
MVTAGGPHAHNATQNCNRLQKPNVVGRMPNTDWGRTGKVVRCPKDMTEIMGQEKAKEYENTAATARPQEQRKAGGQNAT